MRKNYNFINLLKPYAKERAWVALNEENTKVVASAKTMGKLLEKINKSKIKSFSIIQAVPDYSGFAPAN